MAFSQAGDVIEGGSLDEAQQKELSEKEEEATQAEQAFRISQVKCAQTRLPFLSDARHREEGKAGKWNPITDHRRPTRCTCSCCLRRMHQAVKDLSTNIELKEQLMAELSANQQRFEQLRAHYEQVCLPQ